ncbi:MAG: glycosyltransferase 87 family protein [Actinobacteria bacterium]|nr:glycosyltransferase 87 family protein [Actinomycetota bacterium]
MSQGPETLTAEREERAAPKAPRRIGLAIVFLMLAGTLTLGQAIKAPCASGDWGDGRQYTRLCYTDIIPLLATEQLTGGRLPYLDACAETGGGCDEYPVLTMWTMRLTAWASGPDVGGFYRWNVALLWLAAFWLAFCLYQMVGARALYFALAPTLAIYATTNWDLLPAALATAGTLAYLRRRDVWSGVLLGLGAAAKIYPALLVIPFVVGRFRGREPDRGIHLAWAAAGTWIAVNLPFALGGTAGWWEFFRFNSVRAADWDSLWYIACERTTGAGCTNTRLINLASAALFVTWVAVVWWAKAHRDPGFARWTLGFPILVVFLLTNKVYSPQYSIWLLPWFALALPHLRLFVAFEAADVAVFVTRFSWFGTLEELDGGLAGIPIGAFQAAVVIRAIVLVLCVVAWVRRREPVPAPAPQLEPRSDVPAAVPT